MSTDFCFKLKWSRNEIVTSSNLTLEAESRPVQQWVKQYHYWDGFGIKYPTKVDMPLNKIPIPNNFDSHFDTKDTGSREIELII